MVVVRKLWVSWPPAGRRAARVRIAELVARARIASIEHQKIERNTRTTGLTNDYSVQPISFGPHYDPSIVLAPGTL
ncbi:hypothetical protein J2W54_001593 [Rhodococcus fascians]|jgi:hypothetical protein|nr:hypothetical protein [Rhodococcus sp. 3258]MDR6931217.1 hypothetical protein [Rhodococcus fascians]